MNVLSSLYSLGVMLYKVKIGVLPHKGGTLSELPFKIANEEGADMHAVRPGIAQAMVPVVAPGWCERAEAWDNTGSSLQPVCTLRRHNGWHIQAKRQCGDGVGKVKRGSSQTFAAAMKGGAAGQGPAGGAIDIEI